MLDWCNELHIYVIDRPIMLWINWLMPSLSWWMPWVNTTHVPGSILSAVTPASHYSNMDWGALSEHTSGKEHRQHALFSWRAADVTPTESRVATCFFSYTYPSWSYNNLVIKINIKLVSSFFVRKGRNLRVDILFIFYDVRTKFLATCWRSAIHRVEKNE